MSHTSSSRFRTSPLTLKYPPSVSVASIAVYSTRGRSTAAERGRHLCWALKRGRPAVNKFIARLLWDEVMSDGSPLQNYIPDDTTLVPVPSSSPPYPGGLWVARDISAAIASRLFGTDTSKVLLTRSTAVEKSHLQRSGKRNDHKTHLRSIDIVADQLAPPRSIILVDDVITKGNTLYACATILANSFPRTDIRALAIFRTRGYVSDIDRWFEPWLGEVRWARTHVQRHPD